ncbi:MAG: DNA methyltransferase [Candidatus Heimdallarchaeaceae archaeon]
MRVVYFFKLFNSIKSTHEAKYFAKMEIESLFDKVKGTNVIEFSLLPEVKETIENNEHIQNILTYELPYGKIQGYYTYNEKVKSVATLVKRLAYTREVLVFVPKSLNSNSTTFDLYSDGVVGKNVEVVEDEKHVLYRFITHQYFLEKTEYISKLSRNEEEIIRNVETLSKHLIQNLYRIPSSSTLAIGKRLVDYFSIREEPSLYLNHYMHPYKGKFHPKMCRALINYILPKNQGKLLDNFAGSGTTFVETGFLGLDSVGIEINPLSVLMCNVKSNSLNIDLGELKRSFDRLVKVFLETWTKLQQVEKPQKTLDAFANKSKINSEQNKIELKEIYTEIERKRIILNKYFENNYETLKKLIKLRKLIKEEQDSKIRDFLLLTLSGTISDSIRRSKQDVFIIFKNRFMDLYYRLFLYQELNKLLKIPKTSSITFTSDTREIKEINSDSVDAILNSPPYSTALDYIKNDEPQLVLLNLVSSFEKLNEKMIGNPRINYNKTQLQRFLEVSEQNPIGKINSAMKYIKILLDNNRLNDGYRLMKFFIDMQLTLIEMHRVLKPGKKAAIVIGNNHYKIGDAYVEIPNAMILKEIAEKIGFQTDLQIERELQKTSVGNIRKETVLILIK